MSRKHYTPTHLKEIEPATITDPKMSDVIHKLQQLAQDIRDDPEVERSNIFQRLASSLAGKE